MHYSPDNAWIPSKTKWVLPLQIQCAAAVPHISASTDSAQLLTAFNYYHPNTGCNWTAIQYCKSVTYSVGTTPTRHRGDPRPVWRSDRRSRCSSNWIWAGEEWAKPPGEKVWNSEAPCFPGKQTRPTLWDVCFMSCIHVKVKHLLVETVDLCSESSCLEFGLDTICIHLLFIFYVENNHFIIFSLFHKILCDFFFYPKHCCGCATGRFYFENPHRKRCILFCLPSRWRRIFYCKQRKKRLQVFVSCSVGDSSSTSHWMVSLYLHWQQWAIWLHAGEDHAQNSPADNLTLQTQGETNTF